MDALKALALDEYQSYHYWLLMNIKVIAIAMESIIVVIPFLFAKEKRLYPQILLDFIDLLRFIFGDGFLKFEVEMGNIKRWGRAMRGEKKGPFIAKNLLRKIVMLNTMWEKEIIVTWSRTSIVIPTMIGHTITIHNGNEHLLIYITDCMVDHKLAKFSSTLNFWGHVEKNNKS